MQLNWSQSMFIGVAAAAVQYTTAISVTFANGQFDGIKCNWWRPVPRVIDTKHGCSFLSVEIPCYLVLLARINFEKNIYAGTLHSLRHSQNDFVRWWYCRQGVETDCENMLLLRWLATIFFTSWRIWIAASRLKKCRGMISNRMKCKVDTRTDKIFRKRIVCVRKKR